jgi:hypothetical protein
MIISWAMVTWLITIHDGRLSEDRLSHPIVLPFVWRDVAMVSLLSAMPMADLLGRLAARRLSPLTRCGLAVLLAVVFWGTMFNSETSAEVSRLANASPSLRRLAASMCVALSVMLVISAAPPPRSVPTAEDRSRTILRVLCSLAVLLCVPTVYVQARCQQDADHFADLRQQSRFGEAEPLLQRIVALNPSFRKDGQLLRRELRELQHTMAALRKRTQANLPATASIDQQIHYARDLAMLGRSAEARDLLLMNPPTLLDSRACRLLATVYENSQEWRTALHYYEMALTWLPKSSKAMNVSEEQYSITMGKAYCCRRLGQLTEAHTQYQKLLSLNADASTHFLLAQFYEDIQETTQAVHHATIAAKLNSRNYGDKAQRLIQKMQASHFGCFRIQTHSADAVATHQKAF